MRILHLIVTGLFCSFLAFAQAGDTERIPGRLIVHHASTVSSTDASSLIRKRGARLVRRMEKLNLSVIDVTPGTEEAVMDSLRRSGQVTEVEYDYKAKLAGANDPYLASQWYLTKIQATSAWGYTTGSNVPIAVLDTGVDATHPDLASRIIGGWNFVANNNNTQDTMGHGTAVTGVFGAIANNGIGVAGITWSNPIMPLVIVDSNNYAAYSNIAAAIEYAADHGAKIISVSIGGTAPSSALQAAVDYAWNAGAIVVAAAMNNSNSTPNYPAACTNAVAVAATDENDNLASFSDYGSWITVSAPGNNIETTTLGGGYGMWWGTSLATPVVSGVAALALAANPALTPRQLVTLLEQNADDLGAAGFDSTFGWGRVNAYRTVVAAGGGVSTPAAPTSPTTPTTSSSLPFLINAGGPAYTDGSGQIWAADNGYTGGASWSVVNAIANTVAPSLYQRCRYGAFSYNFSVPNGSYTVNLKFAELVKFGPGQRLFNVLINGTQVLTNFDIYAHAGGIFIPIDQSFPVSVTNGQILIQFTYGSADSPMLNGLQISAAGASAPVTTAPTTTTGTSAILMNAGGPSYTDASGATWASDTAYYSGGATWSVANGIGNTSTPAVYQTCRFGAFGYNFTVANGTYNVVLKFAEIVKSGPGQRLFNVLINGTQVLTNFDIYANAGGSYLAVDKSFPVSVVNGQINIQFTYGSADSPMVNAVQIGSPSGQPATALPSFRINAGAGAYTDLSGQVWAADNAYSGGATWSTGASIANTSAPTIYQTCRYGTFAYNLAVPNGNYTVTLKFAEVAVYGAGQRSFNVGINGSPVLTNFDIFAQSGAMYSAIDKAFPVTVTGGQIAIQFTNGPANSPLVSAIQITPSN